jgi:hypothetical protein
MKHTLFVRTTSFIMVLVCASISQQALGGDQDPAQWYSKNYAPVWLTEPWNKAEEATAFYHSSIQLHEPGEGVSTHDSATWISESLEQWKSEGWLGSEMTDLQVDRINESTTAFKSRWRDYYKEADDEYSCGWYVADLMDGEWKFTQYATIDCATHGFISDDG